MNFLADECIDVQIVECLRSEEYEVLYIAEMDPGISDEEVLSKANRQGALLLTADKDFGELVFRQNQFSIGVILARLSGMSPNRKSEIILSVIREHEAELLDAFTVIAPGLVRIRPRSWDLP